MDEPRVRDMAGAPTTAPTTAGVLRQLHAIGASGDRTATLRNLDLPTTVIHGTSDPLVRPTGGRPPPARSRGARLRMIEGMGHDLPRELWPTSPTRSPAPLALDRAVLATRPRAAAEPRAPSAAERSRTSTEFRPHGPEPCASTSSATAARPGNLPVCAPPPDPAARQPTRPSLEWPTLAAIV